MNKLLLIGGGGHCKSCIDVIEQQGIYAIAGIIDRPSELGKKIMGYKLIGTDDDLSRLRNEFDYAFVTVGQIRNADVKIKLYNLLKKLDFHIPFIVSPLAYVSKHAKISQGTIVMHHALVNAGAIVGENCIINTKALIEHDAIIGNHVHVSTGAIINGGVVVSDECFVGSLATTKNSVQIPEKSFIKAGSVVKC
jgi:sugar O-acyltransferase (sialic acid O-acetyltransferase NeuD family)